MSTPSQAGSSFCRSVQNSSRRRESSGNNPACRSGCRWPSGHYIRAMDFSLSDEQRAFQETAGGVLPVGALRRAAALGFAAIYVGEEFGGSGLGRVDAALIFEELAAARPSTAAYLSIHNMVSWMVDRFGTAEQRARLLPKLTKMDHLASYCLTEPGSGSDAAALATR